MNPYESPNVIEPPKPTEHFKRSSLSIVIRIVVCAAILFSLWVAGPVVSGGRRHQIRIWGVLEYYYFESLSGVILKSEFRWPQFAATIVASFLIVAAAVYLPGGKAMCSRTMAKD